MVLGAVAGTLALGYGATRPEADVWEAFMKAVAAGVVTMLALGIAERFWRDTKVSEVAVDPAGGASVRFDDEVASAVADVNEAMNRHVETINRRLYRLEEAVFTELGRGGPPTR